MYRMLLLHALPLAGYSATFLTSDYQKLRSVGAVRFSPDGKRIAYTVTRNDTPKRPVTQLFVMALSDKKPIAFSSGEEPSGGPAWSPDGNTIVYTGTLNGKSGLILASPDATGKRFLAEVAETNTLMPTVGKKVAWSPDGKQIAYVSAQPGPETADASGEPMIITRYRYKPTALEGDSRFSDNKRMHLFAVDVASGKSRQLTNGANHEHSIDWSPDGKEIAFITNLEPHADKFFNSDLMALDVATGATRRLTSTESAEFRPAWSPDGKTIAYEGMRRGLTDPETTMEDTHIWLVGADGKDRRELGVSIDNRQNQPSWSPDGKSIVFSVQERGSTHLYRLPISGGKATAIVDEPGTVSDWMEHGNQLAYVFSTLNDFPQIYLKSGTEPAVKLTDLNQEALRGKSIGRVQALTCVSADNKWDVEAFLTYPAEFQASRKYPLVVVLHGGPHFQQGPAFDFKNQTYASRGIATLMVNYRGSTGYGQAFTDAVFRDQNGFEAHDILQAVSAAIRRNSWIDRERIGIEGISYGGQLAAWIVTQANFFQAVIPTAGVFNLISFSYQTNYNQFTQMIWGQYPHQGNLMDILWERSPLKHVAQVKTPVLLMHGENDADAPIAEAEQFYAALHDVGVETVMVRYPREGHGIRESKHVIDWIDRSLAWYEKHFTRR